MTAIAFDTHAFVKRLTAAGMPEKQAEILAEEQTRLIDERLATKEDIAAVQRDIADVRRDMKELESRLTANILKWMFTAMIAQTAMIAALVRLF